MKDEATTINSPRQVLLIGGTDEVKAAVKKAMSSPGNHGEEVLIIGGDQIPELRPTLKEIPIRMVQYPPIIPEYTKSGKQKRRERRAKERLAAKHLKQKK